MTNQEIISRLKRLKVETGSLACLGCGHEHNCSTGGCAIIRAAVAQLEKTMDRCARYAEEIAVLQERQKWVPVTERLPESGVPVLINYIGNDDSKMHPDGVAVWVDWGCLWWEGSIEDCDTEVTVPITHWMPLPKAPEEE